VSAGAQVAAAAVPRVRGNRPRSARAVPPVPPHPLVPLAASLLLGVALSDDLGAVLSHPARLLVLAAAGTFAVLSLWPGRTWPLWAQRAAVCVAIGLVGVARHQAVLDLPANHVAHLAGPAPVLTRIEARVETEPVTTPIVRRNPFARLPSQPTTRFIVAARTLRTGGRPVEIDGWIRVQVLGRAPPLSPGDVVVLTGELSAPAGPANPGEADWAAILARQGIHAVLRIESAAHIEVVARSAGGWSSITAAARRFARAATLDPHSAAYGDEPRLIDAIVLGQRSSVDQRMNEAFLRTGAIHFLTVSGFHMAIIAAGVWLAANGLLAVTLRPPRRRAQQMSACVVLVTVVGYMTVVEPNPPVIRASLAAICVSLAVLANRRGLALNSLAAAVLAIVLYAPNEIFRAGFQLSFVQMFALLTFVPRLRRYLDRRADPLAALESDGRAPARRVLARVGSFLRLCLVVPLTCWLVSLPIVAFHFGRVAPYGAVQSLLLTPIVIVVVWLGFAALVLGPAPLVGPLLRTALHESSGLLMDAVDVLARLPLTLIDAPALPAWCVLCAYLVGCAWWLLLPAMPSGGAGETESAGDPPPRPRWRLHGAALGAIAGLLLAGWTAERAAPPPAVQVWVLSVGNGAAVLVVEPNGDAGVVDVGTTRNFDAGETVLAAMRAVGAGRLRWAVISNARGSRVSGLRTLLARDPALPVYTSARERPTAPGGVLRSILAATPATRGNARELRAGDVVPLGTLRLEVLYPDQTPPALPGPGDRSLVFRLCAGPTSILFTGDIDASAGAALVAAFEGGALEVRADALVAPSAAALARRELAALVAAAEPQVVIVSASTTARQAGGGPQAISGGSIDVLDTAEAGAVCIELPPDGDLRVITPYRRSLTRREEVP